MDSSNHELLGVSGEAPAGPATRDLAQATGLPLRLSQSGEVLFGDGLPAVAPRIRTLDEIRAVLYNQTATGPSPLYFMYRRVGWPEDVARMASYSLRYDLTVLAPGLVGGEFVKTAGHYHPAPDEKSDGPGYPELYQVVHGRAHYLLQLPEKGDRAGVLADVVVVEAGPGDLLYVPPGYGHVTINIGNEPLVMVNVVEATFSSLYGPYRERHGAAYYEIEELGRGYFVPNDHYPDPPKPRLAPPTGAPLLGLSPGEPLYRRVASDPRGFGFLTRPSPGGPAL